MTTGRIGFAVALAGLAVAVGFGLRDLLAPLAANEEEALATSGIAFAAFLALCAIAGASLSRDAPCVRLGLGAGRLGAGEIAALAFGTIALSQALDGLLVITGLKAHSALHEFEVQLRGVRGRGLALAILSFGFAAGTSEELLCRGLVQRGLVRRLGPAPGIALAAAFFGALHVDPVHALFATGLGLYLGAVAELADSVRPAMVCHVLNNLLAVLSTAWSGLLDPPSLRGVLILGGVALATLALVWRGARGVPGRPGPGVGRGPPGVGMDASSASGAGVSGPGGSAPPAGGGAVGELQPRGRSDDS